MHLKISGKVFQIVCKMPKSIFEYILCVLFKNIKKCMFVMFEKLIWKICISCCALESCLHLKPKKNNTLFSIWIKFSSRVSFHTPIPKRKTFKICYSVKVYFYSATLYFYVEQKPIENQNKKNLRKLVSQNKFQKKKMYIWENWENEMSYRMMTWK